MLTELVHGRPVDATDGRFGELSACIVDPQSRRVSHLVIEPHGRHHLARLVPVDRVTARVNCLNVDLSKAEIRQLQRVAYSDFIELGTDVETTDEWDVGVQEVLGMPYWSVDVETKMGFDHVDVDYDRIPKGECEIRRHSEAFTSDGLSVGQVEGFLAEHNELLAVIVRTGSVVRNYQRLVPMGAVSSVTNDRIWLSLDRSGFEDLPLSRRYEAEMPESDRPLLWQRTMAFATQFLERERKR